MGEVIISIDVDASVDKVFNLVREPEKIVSLMPSDWEVDVTKLTEGPTQIGTRYHSKIKKGALSLDWVDQIEVLSENEELLARSVEGVKFDILRWTLTSINGKTRLTRHVKYTLPYSFIGSLLDKLLAENSFRKTGIEWLQNIKAHLEK